MRDLPPIHPGEQLGQEFIKPLGITAYRLAEDIGVPVARVQAIIAGAAWDHRGWYFRHLARVVAEHATGLRAGNRSGGLGGTPPLHSPRLRCRRPDRRHTSNATR